MSPSPAHPRHRPAVPWCCSQGSGASEAPEILLKIPKTAADGEVSPPSEACVGSLPGGESPAYRHLWPFPAQRPGWWAMQIGFCCRTKIGAFFSPFSFLITASQAWKCYPALCNNPREHRGVAYSVCCNEKHLLPSARGQKATPRKANKTSVLQEMCAFTSYLFHSSHTSADKIPDKSWAETAQFAKSWAVFTSTKAIYSFAPNSTKKKKNPTSKGCFSNRGAGDSFFEGKRSLLWLIIIALYKTESTETF